MNKANLKLVIVPQDCQLQDLFNYDPAKYGSTFSTCNDINVNKVGDIYSILYTDDSFKKIDVRKLMDNIYKLFNHNLPGHEIHISMLYLYETNSDNESSLAHMDFDAADVMMQLDVFMVDNDDFGPDSKFNFIYERDKIYEEMLQDIHEASELLKRHEEEVAAEEGRRKVNEARMGKMFGVNPTLPYQENPMAMYPSLDFDAVDDYRYKSKKSKKKKHYYDSSRVIKAAGNPKKTYKRHGVVVCSNKKAIRKDERTIKEFLKEFIPGNSDWKKRLRKDLLKRWMNVYVVTKSELKHYEKKHRKYYRRKDNSERNKQILDFTSKMLTVPVNNWNNPNK